MNTRRYFYCKSISYLLFNIVHLKCNCNFCVEFSLLIVEANPFIILRYLRFSSGGYC